LGPFAEDFYDAFRLGLGESTIGLGDIDGVNFAATQGLERRTSELRERLDRQAAEAEERVRTRDEEIQRLRDEVAELHARLSVLSALEGRLEGLEAATADADDLRLTGTPAR